MPRHLNEGRPEGHQTVKELECTSSNNLAGWGNQARSQLTTCVDHPHARRHPPGILTPTAQDWLFWVLRVIPQGRHWCTTLKNDKHVYTQ